MNKPDSSQAHLLVAGPADILPTDSLSAPPVAGPGVVASSRSPDEVARLRKRSQHMERLLRQLPARSSVVRADTEGRIVELQDRLAAVDQRLNEMAVAPVAVPIQSGPDSSARAYGENSVGAATPMLWRQRVELMDELVRARFIEADAAGF